MKRKLLLALTVMWLSGTTAHAQELDTDTVSDSVVWTHGKGLPEFLSRMAALEGQGNQRAVNRYGHMGLYQFHPKTIRSLGFRVSRRRFLNDKALQDTVMMAYLRSNAADLRDIIARYVGREVRGVTVTKSGILASAHLVGDVGVRAFFNPKKYRARTTDGNGVTVAMYMRRFAHYNLDL